jgi:trans-aconitate methyltransferase
MNQWNVELYEQKHAYVWQYGANLLEMLAPSPKEYILDLGYGTGQLTAQIAATGAEVVGLDAADSAIAQCRQNYPQIEFVVANGADFARRSKSFDAVFSNAALHWIQPPVAAVKCIYQSLKPGGRLVAEFGGKGNLAQIMAAINAALKQPEYNPWYFPSISEYTTILEQQGFVVNYAVLFSRPTKLEGENGLANWVEMFAGDRLNSFSLTTKATILNEIASQLRSTLYRDGHWWADYCRIRIVARKPG